MKQSKGLSSFFGVLGVLAVAVGIFLSFFFMNASPVLLAQPQAAMDQAVRLLDAVCAERMDIASELLYETPDIGADREPADAVGCLLWDAYIDSISYEVKSECYATDSGVALDVTITALDLNSVTSTLRERSQIKLEQRVAAAEDADEIYDEKGDYLEEFVMDVLYDSAVDALAQDARMVSKDVTMSLVYDDGLWWVMPDAGLMDAISAGMLK